MLRDLPKNPPTIYPLFSAPVYCQFNTGFRLNETLIDELAELPGLGDDCGLSKNINILDRPDLKQARELCEYHLQQYVKDICSFDNEIYITTSWLSRNPKGVDHPPHFHPNSLFSGCLYLRSSSDNRLSFHGNNHFTSHFPLTYNLKEFNIYNSNDWWVPVDTGTIVIFPSDLKHSASPNTLDQVRVALCFNSFIKGTLGGPGDYAGRLEIK